MDAIFKPQHINACPDDISGNNQFGRYIFLTGSDERAREISEHFNQVTVKTHPRHHNLYLGTLTSKQGHVDVGSIAIGMGGPSADIIINELILVGARRFLRVGTTASLQSEQIKIGDLIVATAAVRDDKASWDYIYPEFPAMASIEYINAAGRASQLFSPENIGIHFGIVHSKSSLFAREYNFSLIDPQKNYMHNMKKAGVLATEMECAQLFILSSLMSTRLRAVKPNGPEIYSGAILAVIGDDNNAFCDIPNQISDAIKAAIKLSIETTLEMNKIDQKITSPF